jgi:hypothetical protein
MNDQYFTDTNKFSIEKFRNILKTKDILPGRVILKDKIDERFDLLKSKGIQSLSDLLEALKSKPKTEKFSNESGLSIDYLTILKREANSYVSTPMNLTELPFAETEFVEILQNSGIRDTRKLFNIAAKLADREKLAQKYKIPIGKLTELVQLTDLVRITGVGPVFARIIYDSGIRSAREFLSIEAPILLQMLTNTNNEKGLTKSKFSIKDIEYCLELGKDLPIVMQD